MSLSIISHPSASDARWIKFFIELVLIKLAFVIRVEVLLELLCLRIACTLESVCFSFIELWMLLLLRVKCLLLLNTVILVVVLAWLSKIKSATWHIRLIAIFFNLEFVILFNFRKPLELQWIMVKEFLIFSWILSECSRRPIMLLVIKLITWIFIYFIFLLIRRSVIKHVVAGAIRPRELLVHLLFSHDPVVLILILIRIKLRAHIVIETTCIFHIWSPDLILLVLLLFELILSILIKIWIWISVAVLAYITFITSVTTFLLKWRCIIARA